MQSEQQGLVRAITTAVCEMAVHGELQAVCVL